MPPISTAAPLVGTLIRYELQRKLELLPASGLEQKRGDGALKKIGHRIKIRMLVDPAAKLPLKG